MAEVYNRSSRYSFLAEPFHCDFKHQLLLGQLGNHLLNAADFHSGEHDFGVVYLKSLNYTWVLSRLAIEMDAMPVEYERFSVETWIESVYRFFTNRNFSIEGNSGKVYGHGRSVWAMIDKDSRKPVDLLSVKDGAIQDYVIVDKECPMAKPSRVTMTDKASLAGSVVARYCDLDINGHVNSVKYIEHVLDLFSKQFYETRRVQRFEIAYVEESYYGDTLNFYMEEKNENEYCISIKKSEPNGTDAVEVCRSKVKFVND